MIIKCQVCDEEFTTYPSKVKKGRGQFCSRECYAKALSKRMTGKGHPMYGRHHRPDSIAKMRRKAQARAENQTGENSPQWKGGRHYSHGYLMVALSSLSPQEQETLGIMATRSAGRYIPEHRLVMARHLGRPLTKAERVHHVNGVKDDNRIENLELHASNRSHTIRHKELMAELSRLRVENERLRFLLATCRESG